FAGLAVRDVQTGQDVFTLSAARSSSVAFSPDGALLAVSSSTARTTGVRLFRMESGEELPSFNTDEIPPTALCSAPSGRRLAVGRGREEAAPADRQGEVRLWRTDLEREDPTFTPFPLAASLGLASALVFSPDGRFLAVAHDRGFVRLLDARVGREVGFLNVGGSLTTAPVFSPDRRSLALTSRRDNDSEDTLSLWEMSSGNRRWSVTAVPAVTALAFAPRGPHLLATGHRDSTALLWDVSGLRTRRPAARPGAGTEQLWASL